MVRAQTSLLHHSLCHLPNESLDGSSAKEICVVLNSPNYVISSLIQFHGKVALGRVGMDFELIHLPPTKVARRAVFGFQNKSSL